MREGERKGGTHHTCMDTYTHQQFTPGHICSLETQLNKNIKPMHDRHVWLGLLTYLKTIDLIYQWDL